MTQDKEMLEEFEDVLELLATRVFQGTLRGSTSATPEHPMNRECMFAIIAYSRIVGYKCHNVPYVQYIYI